MASTEQVVLISSLGTAVTELRKTKSVVDAKTVLAWYIRRRNDTNSVEAKLAKSYDNDQILEFGGRMCNILTEDPVWLGRLARLVLTPFYESIGRRELSDAGVERDGAEAAEAVCTALESARENYGGKLPSDDFEWVWDHLGCVEKS